MSGFALRGVEQQPPPLPAGCQRPLPLSRDHHNCVATSTHVSWEAGSSQRDPPPCGKRLERGTLAERVLLVAVLRQVSRKQVSSEQTGKEQRESAETWGLAELEKPPSSLKFL